MLNVQSAQNLAGQAGKAVGRKVASTSRGGVEEGRRRYRRRRRARSVERRLTSAARRLPVDTPIDRRRRSRTAGRVMWVVRLMFVAAIGACLYTAWRSRKEARRQVDEGPAPDAFGAAVEASGDGERAPSSKTHP